MLDTQYDKNGQTLYSLATSYSVDLPALVKDATISTTAPASNTPATLFADPVLRMFPCHTKEATIVSAIYLYGQAADGIPYPKKGLGLDIAADKLEKAAMYWGVLSDVENIRRDISKIAADRDAVRDTDYALVVDYAGTRSRKFPIRNAEALNKAASDLYAERLQMPFPWRKQAAINILNRAVRDNVNIEDHDAYFYLVKAAGISPVVPKEAASNLQEYAFSFDNRTIREHVKQAASVIDQNPEADISELCTCLDMLAREGRYTRATPEEVLFSGPPVKEASDSRTVGFQNGKVYPATRIKDAGIDPILAVCGDSIAGAVSDVTGTFDIDKAAEVLPTLPRNMADSLCAIYEKSAGLVPLDPIEKSAIAGRRQRRLAKSRADKYMDLEEWKRMAEEKGMEVADNPCWTMTMSLK